MTPYCERLFYPPASPSFEINIQINKYGGLTTHSTSLTYFKDLIKITSRISN